MYGVVEQLKLLQGLGTFLGHSLYSSQDTYKDACMCIAIIIALICGLSKLPSPCNCMHVIHA